MLVTSGGMLIRLKVKEISVIGRNTQGVRLISLEPSEKVTGISKLPEESEEAEEAPPTEPTSTPPEPPTSPNGAGGETP
jgi:DNA gyrase subunit A